MLEPSLGLFTGIAAMAGFLAFVAIYGATTSAWAARGRCRWCSA